MKDNYWMFVSFYFILVSIILIILNVNERDKKKEVIINEDYFISIPEQIEECKEAGGRYLLYPTTVWDENFEDVPVYKESCDIPESELFENIYPL